MQNFCYAKANTKAEALKALAEVESPYLVAGATNVSLNIRDKKVNERTLVDIRGIEELRFIEDAGEEIIIGAVSTISDLEKSELIKNEAHALWQAAISFADPTTRNSATIAGNIANASPAADTATPLLVLGAVVVIEKAGSVREVAIEDFFVFVGKTVLEADEMITAIKIKKMPTTSFIKMGLRRAMAISVANVAVCMACADGKVSAIHIAMGSVAPTPVRCKNAEAALIGTDCGEAAMAAMAEALKSDISPINDIRSTAKYRNQVAPVLVKRAIKAACSCEGGAE